MSKYLIAVQTKHENVVVEGFHLAERHPKRWTIGPKAPKLMSHA